MAPYSLGLGNMFRKKGFDLGQANKKCIVLTTVSSSSASPSMSDFHVGIERNTFGMGLKLCQLTVADLEVACAPISQGVGADEADCMSVTSEAFQMHLDMVICEVRLLV